MANQTNLAKGKRRSESLPGDNGDVVVLHRGEVKKRRGEKEENKWKVILRDGASGFEPCDCFFCFFS